MKIQRKLVGTRADMIQFLTEARDAVVAADEAMTESRTDTRIKRSERHGYRDGLDFAVQALKDWEPTKENDTDGQSAGSPSVLQGVPQPVEGSTAPRVGAMRNPSSRDQTPTTG